MGFLHAHYLAAKQSGGCESWVVKRRKAEPVVYGIRSSEDVLIRDVVIESHRAEILPNLLFGIRKGLGKTTPQILAIGQWIQVVHKGQHGWIQVGNLNQSATRPGRQQTAPRVLIRNNGQAAESQPLPEPFVVAKQEHLVPLDRASERSSKLVPSKGRDVVLIEEVLGIQYVIAQNSKSDPCS